jgi:predicted O-methyltransferase YrrM
MNPVLERLYREREVVRRDGRRVALFPTGLGEHRGQYLFELVRSRRPACTLEVGFAYGLSTLFIAEALRQNGGGHHHVIDPKQRTRFDELGLRHVDEAGLSSWITFHEQPAELCLPTLVDQGLAIDLAFDDGGHLFDQVIVEFVFLARLLRRGGVLIFDDDPLPGVSRACDFIATNRPDFAAVTEAARPGLLRGLFDRHPIPPPPKGMRAFQKTADEDPRDWKDFTPF